MKRYYLFIFLLVSAFSYGQNCASVTDATNTPITSTSPVLATVEVPDDVLVTDINITINLLHSFLSDLNITLQSPAGTATPIILVNGCGGANITDATFDDDGGPLVCDDGIRPGTYQPEGPLSIFNGENAQGTWTLIITDLVPLDDGVYQSMSLEYCTDDVLAVNTTDINSITMYPNPTNSNNLFFTLGNLSEAKVTITNILGQNALTTTINSSKNSLDISNLSNGTYLVTIQDDTGASTSRKLIKR